MNNLLWLIRREIWENRSLWIAPLVIAGVILVIAAFGGINVGGEDFSFGNGPGHSEWSGIEPGLDKREAIYAFTIGMFTFVQLLALGIVVFFYLLDSMLSERKDRSILFWKSLPLSDSEVVASKVLTALLVAPVFVLLVSAVSQLLFGLVWWLRFGGTGLAEILTPWDAGMWLKVQAGWWLLVPAVLVWYLPIAGYLLLVSAWARKNAFLWAILPPAALLLMEGLLMQSTHVAQFLGRRFGGLVDVMEFDADRRVSPDSALGELAVHVGRVFTHYETWLGVLVAAVFITAVVRIRRHRDDS